LDEADVGWKQMSNGSRCQMEADDEDGGKDVLDHRRPCCIYRVMSSSECEGSCLNVRATHAELGGTI